MLCLSPPAEEVRKQREWLIGVCNAGGFVPPFARAHASSPQLVLTRWRPPAAGTGAGGRGAGGRAAPGPTLDVWRTPAAGARCYNPDALLAYLLASAAHAAASSSAGSPGA